MLMYFLRLKRIKHSKTIAKDLAKSRTINYCDKATKRLWISLKIVRSEFKRLNKVNWTTHCGIVFLTELKDKKPWSSSNFTTWTNICKPKSNSMNECINKTSCINLQVSLSLQFVINLFSKVLLTTEMLFSTIPIMSHLLK